MHQFYRLSLALVIFVTVCHMCWIVYSYKGQVVHFSDDKRRLVKSSAVNVHADNGYKTDIYERLNISKSTVIKIQDLPLSYGFQPDVDVEFPFEERDTPRIPHILHQIWLTNETVNASVPSRFADNVVNLIKHNPKWTYYFWTEDSAVAFLVDHFPKLLELYNFTEEVVVRSDILRYAIIYHFGGVYVDVDTQCFRNLDIVTWKYPCILVPTPFERSNIQQNRFYYFVNGEILCRAKHPLFKKILNFLEERPRQRFGGCSLGPFFITRHYLEYNNITGNVSDYPIDIYRDNTSSPYIYKGTIPAQNDDGIYVPNSRYFLTNHQGGFLSNARKRCNETNHSANFERACEVLRLHRFQTLRSNYSFLDHTFAYSWGKHNRKRQNSYVAIKDLKQDFEIYA